MMTNLIAYQVRHTNHPMIVVPIVVLLGHPMNVEVLRLVVLLLVRAVVELVALRMFPSC